jgi:hypothetical protein
VALASMGFAHTHAYDSPLPKEPLRRTGIEHVFRPPLELDRYYDTLERFFGGGRGLTLSWPPAGVARMRTPNLRRDG